MPKRVDRVGEVNINNQGLKMWIKDYRGNKEIDIEFEDGYVCYNREYKMFKRKIIFNPNYKSVKFINREGEINYNNNGSKMTIIEYKNNKDIKVKFDNNYEIKSNYTDFKNGNIASPYDKTIYEKGYIGEGKYKASENERNTKQFSLWINIFKRCYDEKTHIKQPTYIDCMVCEEWYNFQNFAQWYDKNYYMINNELMCIDKDILVKGNKIYSPETCIFVPERINGLFIKRQNDRGEYPIGVSWSKTGNKYVSNCNKLENGKTKQIYLGLSNTSNEAFYKYKIFKEKVIKEVADEYKDKIPNKLYEALYRYEVEITD